MRLVSDMRPLQAMLTPLLLSNDRAAAPRCAAGETTFDVPWRKAITTHRLQEITGYRIEKIDGRDGPHKHGYAAFDENGAEILYRCGWTANEGLKKLGQAIYEYHCQIVRERQEHRCLGCGGLYPLQVDHIISRAQGRDDRLENLRGLCCGPLSNRCHDRRHGIKVA